MRVGGAGVMISSSFLARLARRPGILLRAERLVCSRGPDSVQWQVTTSPELTLSRLDGPPIKVVILQHPEYGPCPPGVVTFHVGSEDSDSVWPPYSKRAQQQAAEAYAAYGGDPAELVTTVFADPLTLVSEFLRDPDLTRWRRRARALVAGAATVPLATAGTRGTAADSVRGALADRWSAESYPHGPGGDRRPLRGVVHVFRTVDASGVALVLIVDDAEPEEWTAIAVLGREAGRAARNAWLHWSDLLQFLTTPGRAEGVSLNAEDLDPFEVERLAVLGGGQKRTSAWDREITPYLDESDTALVRLAGFLARHGAQTPVFGYELGESGWPADFAWPAEDIRIAVLPEPDGDDDEETRRGGEAYVAAGWRAQTASEWCEQIDALLAAVPRASA